MNDPEFIESIECKEIAEMLISKYYPFIGYVNLDLIHFVEMDGYKGKNAPPYIMSGLTQSWAREFCNLLEMEKFIVLESGLIFGKN